MEAVEITKIIENEIAGNWHHPNVHGVDLKKCLVLPTKQNYKNPTKNNQSETIELWLVLEELPESKGGYKIIFDEQSRRFGLAIEDTENKNVFLGLYGTFLQTLDAM